MLLFLGVFVGFYLLNLNELNEVEETMKTTGYLYVTWYDQQLDWTASSFGGITEQYFPQVSSTTIIIIFFFYLVLIFITKTSLMIMIPIHTNLYIYIYIRLWLYKLLLNTSIGFYYILYLVNNCLTKLVMEISIYVNTIYDI